MMSRVCWFFVMCCTWKTVEGMDQNQEAPNAGAELQIEQILADSIKGNVMEVNTRLASTKNLENIGGIDIGLLNDPAPYVTGPFTKGELWKTMDVHPRKDYKIKNAMMRGLADEDDYPYFVGDIRWRTYGTKVNAIGANGHRPYTTKYVYGTPSYKSTGVNSEAFQNHFAFLKLYRKPDCISPVSAQNFRAPTYLMPNIFHVHPSVLECLEQSKKNEKNECWPDQRDDQKGKKGTHIDVMYALTNFPYKYVKFIGSDQNVNHNLAMSPDRVFPDFEKQCGSTPFSKWCSFFGNECPEQILVNCWGYHNNNLYKSFVDWFFGLKSSEKDKLFATKDVYDSYGRAENPQESCLGEMAWNKYDDKGPVYPEYATKEDSVRWFYEKGKISKANERFVTADNEDQGFGGKQC